MIKSFTIVSCFLLLMGAVFAQSVSFNTFMNPVIPGDHPDCTITKIGNDFYTTGSSFNPTPVIYHSTDLVHWEAIAQPVSAAWSNYSDAAAGGCWGGQMVYYNNKYWHFFSRASSMYFTTADDPKGTWSMPSKMNTPAQVPGLGYDNSIFIDDDGRWFLVVKNGQVNNWIVELGDNGQPQGRVYDLTWLNPAPDYPFSWAEGPVLWKFNGRYYYSFARNVGGGQKVFMSDSLTDDENSWTNLGDFFNESDPLKSSALFTGPNHSSAPVTLNDGTHWVIHPLWRSGNNSEWHGQGRQGLLNQVFYDANGKPTADYPVNVPKAAPKLPGSGIPWMVPHSDFFNGDKLNPEWSFLGWTPASSYSLSNRPGWFTLSPKSRRKNTIIKNDGEHNYSIITKVDFDPASVNDQAGIQIFNGCQTLYVKLYSSIDSSGNRIVAFSFDTNYYDAENPDTGSVVHLKLVRINHVLKGYFSANGYEWIQVGNSIDVSGMDNAQPDYNKWTGNRQGLYVQGNSADFDYFIYRDAYTPILAECPANQNGTSITSKKNGISSLDNIHNDDWVLYAGVELGNDDYQKYPDSLSFTAACNSTGGIIEVWLDSLDSNNKIAECTISNTGSWDTYETFSTKVLKPVSGYHDVYLRFKGSGTDKLFLLQWFSFINTFVPTGVKQQSSLQPKKFLLEQNYPNPFNPSTVISYQLPASLNPSQGGTFPEGMDSQSSVNLKVYDLLGREVASLVNGEQCGGYYKVEFDGSKLSSGVYFYTLKAGDFIQTKKMTLLK